MGSGLVVLWNTLLAPRLLKERLTVSRAGGAAIIIVGTVCVALTGRHDNQREHTAKQLANLMLSPLAITYYACAFAWALVLLLVRQAMREPLRRALAQTVLAGSLSGAPPTPPSAPHLAVSSVPPSCRPRAVAPPR